MIIRSKTFKQWFKANFTKEEMRDMVNHGVDGGFHLLTYYSDTVKIYETFKMEIHDALQDDAESYGYSNVHEFMATFNKDHAPGNYTQSANQMTWYMAERTARELTDED